MLRDVTWCDPAAVTPAGITAESATTGAGLVAIVPVKRLAQAKSRLAVPDRVRRTLALAFAVDTISAVIRCPAVERVVVVTADPRVRRALGHKQLLFADEGRTAGLAAAVEAAHGLAAKHGRGTVVVPADLPAVTPAALGRALDEAVRHDAAFVRDARGDGTTLLVRAHTSALENAYGPASADRHVAAGFSEICGVSEGVSQDVDDLHDLDVAARLGVGPLTTALLSRFAGQWSSVGRSVVHRAGDPTRA
jgi:2-phospho-L-lactate guanylyltransferase